MSDFYKEICFKTIDVARGAAKFVRSAHQVAPGNIESKGRNDFVTSYDKRVEKDIIRALLEILPEAGVLGEEATANSNGKRFTWVIDPIDGTTNFIHGLFPYCISIGLLEFDQPVMGVVHEVGHEETFYSWKESQAYMNGNVISVSRSTAIQDCLIATGFPYSNFNRLESYIESMKYFMKESHGVRRLGSAAADLAYVACGRFDAFYEYDLKPWDVVAGAFIVKQAGGRVSDFSGGDNYIHGGELIASNNNVYQSFAKVVNEFMKG